MLTRVINALLIVATVSFMVGLGCAAMIMAWATDNWTFAIIPIGIWLIIVATWLYQSINNQVPTVCYGDYRIFGKRIGKTVEEGLHWKWWWQKIKVYSAEIKSIPTDESFTTNDKVEVTIKGQTQYLPDKELISKRFSTLSEATIRDGLNSIIKEELGAIAGRYGYRDFFEKRMYISQLINCLLRMGEPPHLNIGAIAGVCGLRSKKEVLKKCLANGIVIVDNEVPPGKRIEFYELFTHQIRTLLEKEGSKNTRSRIEEEYAIDIDHFALSDISWTEKFRDIMEREQQAAVEVAAREQKADAVLKLATRIRGKKKEIEKKTALHAAMGIHGQSKHQIIAIEGVTSGVMPIIGNLTGDQNDE